MKYRGIEISSKEKHFTDAIKRIDNYWNEYYKRKREHENFLYVISKGDIK